MAVTRAFWSAASHEWPGHRPDRCFAELDRDCLPEQCVPFYYAERAHRGMAERREHDVMSEVAVRDPPAPVRSPRLVYIPALDGLRALAVMAVLLYHGGVNWIPGGFLGVDVFFVISGYLITSLLLRDWSEHGSIQLGRFYVRRARRLLPALFLMLGVVSLYSLVFLPDTVAELRGAVIATLVYVENWHLISHDVSYFVSAGRPSLLRHVWSLAVEEQFYLLWPLLFSLLLARWGRRSRSLLRVILGGALVSAVLMAVQYQRYGDPSRVYFGTDTRASTLLIGAALAIVWTPWRLHARHRPQRTTRTRHHGGRQLLRCRLVLPQRR